MTDANREDYLCNAPHPDIDIRCIKPRGHDGAHGAGFESWEGSNE